MSIDSGGVDPVTSSHLTATVDIHISRDIVKYTWFVAIRLDETKYEDAVLDNECFSKR